MQIETWTPILHLQERIFNIIDASIPNKAQNSALKGLVASAVGDCINQIANESLLGDKPQGEQVSGTSTFVHGPVTTEPLTIIP